MTTDTRELLAMLTPHGVDIGRVHGGTPKLTALDIAAAMGMSRISRKQGLLLMVKYCDEQALRSELWQHWFRDVMDKAHREGWQTQPGQIDMLSNITLDECIGSNNCSACRGTCFVMVGNKKVYCDMCQGTGKRYMSERRLSAGLGISRRQYRQHWQSRMNWASSTLNAWEASAAERISRGLS